jgi:integrase
MESIPEPQQIDYIITQGTRVLFPSEWEKLRAAMLTPEQSKLVKVYTADGDIAKANHIQRYQIVCDMLLHTGMRVVEAQALQKGWYHPSRRVIAIPQGACKKVKCTFTERTVMLSPRGCAAVDRYLNSGCTISGKETSRDTLRRYAIKAGIGKAGITTKMFRKTLASWLMACFPERVMHISSSMGYSREVLRKYYLGKGFPRSELEKMRAYLQGWGIQV